jgi:hypothetical protein
VGIIQLANLVEELHKEFIGMLSNCGEKTMFQLIGDPVHIIMLPMHEC